MKDSSLALIIVSIIPTVVFLLITTIFIIKFNKIRKEKVEDEANSNRISVIRQFMIVSSVILLFLGVNLVYFLLHTNRHVEYTEMSIIYFYLFSVMIPVILMGDLGYLTKSHSSFRLSLTIISFSLILGGLLLFQYHVNQVVPFLKIFSVAFNLAVSATLIIKLIKKKKEGQNRPMGDYIKLICLISCIMAFNFLFFLYFSSQKSIIMYSSIISLFSIIHCMEAYRIFKEKPLVAVTTGNETIVLSGEFFDDGENAGDNSSAMLQKRLLNTMEIEKTYLRPDISIITMSSILGTNKTYLSKVINTDMRRNFRDLVNYYRIREAIKKYDECPDINLNELASTCGFRNISSFTNAFRINTGHTPGEWCREVRNMKRRMKILEMNQQTKSERN